MRKNMAKLNSTFNCSNCGKIIWSKYHKLPNEKIVCTKCYNLYNNRDKIESYLNMKKVIENL